LQISDDRKKRVIDLYFNQHKTYAEIAEIERISPRDIHVIVKEEQAGRQKYKHQQQLQEVSAKAYELFNEKKSPVEVAIILNLREPQVTKYNREYWKLKGLNKLNIMHKETNGNTWPLWKLYKELIKKRGMSIAQVVNVVDIAINKLPHMESLYKQLKDEVDKLLYTRQGLLNDIAALKYKISLLDRTVFSLEQDFKRKEQQLQELTDKKNRLEK
jgi:DNA-binding CsgD family transcriptional regulator